jgi:hypothetical protein
MKSDAVYDGIARRGRIDNNSIDVVTIRDGSIKIAEFYDDKQYTQKLENIMESVTVKEELGEMVLWGHTVKSFFGKVKQHWIITNHRIMFIEYKTNQAIQLPLKYIDVVVMNARTSYNSEGVGVGAFVPASISLGMGFLERRGTSRKVGDLAFMLNGQVLLVFSDVIDPGGVKQMIYQAKKQMRYSKNL